MITDLDIYVESILNSKILIIKDCSFYNPDIPVTSAKIEIQYPTSDKYVLIPVSKNFSYIVNSNTLGITNVNNPELLTSLPDGIWTIKYSICPNDKLFVEYTFLRNTKQLIKYHNLFCDLNIDKCNLKKEDLEKLKNIKLYIDSAKYLVDDCNKPEKGIELYNYVDSLINEFNKDCKCQ